MVILLTMTSKHVSIACGSRQRIEYRRIWTRFILKDGCYSIILDNSPPP